MTRIVRARTGETRRLATWGNARHGRHRHQPSPPRVVGRTAGRTPAVVEGLALDGELAASAALLVSEVVTNSVLHAGLDASDHVHVDAWWADGRLRVEVCDEGGGLRRPSPAPPREGGRGLDLIGYLAERWGVHCDGHTRVWFELAA